MKKSTGIYVIIIVVMVLTACSQNSASPSDTPTLIPDATESIITATTPPQTSITSPTVSASPEITDASPSDTPTLIPDATENIITATTPPQTPSITPPALSTGPEITDVSWMDDMNSINISISPWPDSWPWKMYLDGEEIPMEGGADQFVIRPNAPLDRSPTGLIVGSLPWVSGIDSTDFPCCGTLQFDIPGKGLTNTYRYEFGGLCKTKSTKTCAPKWTVHEGDLVISGSDTLLIENITYQQEGNIYVQDTATLTIRNSDLKMMRGSTPTIHVYIFVDPQAVLNIESSRIYAGDGLACVMNSGTINMVDSPTSIHYLDMSDGAHLSMVNSELINDIGGILQIGGGSTSITDSTIGAIGLMVPNNGHLDANGIKPGTYFGAFDIHDLIPEANYDLVMKNTSLL